MTPTPPSPYAHAEAFMLMTYACPVGHRETIWNSRDGVTPFCVDCRTCDADAQHVSWHDDVRAVNHIPARGDRYFRDGLPEEARAIMRRRIEQTKNTYPISQEEADKLIDRAGQAHANLDDYSSEFHQGWPKLVVAGTDEG